VERADRIVRGLVDFSSQRSLTREPIRLGAVVDDVLLLVKHELTRSNTRVSVRIEKDLPFVFLDRSKFEQVLINLIINAVHAMEGRNGKQLKIRVRSESLDEVVKNEGARKREVFRSGDRVAILEISDTGHGISAADTGRLFDPFFTTKPTGKGTGLGLSVARRIVELHGGEIILENRADGPGAMARIILPTRPETGKVRVGFSAEFLAHPPKEIDTGEGDLPS
jgi:two-component system NtrC family sensor kinase